MKKVLGIVLAVLTLAAVFPTTASAVGGVKSCIKAPCTTLPPTVIGGGGNSSGFNNKGSGTGTSAGGGHQLPPSPAGR